MAIFTAIGAAIFGAGTFMASATAGVLAFGASTALSYVSRALSGKPANQQTAASRGVSGVQGTLQAAGDVPRSFPLGPDCTAGSLVYANFWGNDGETPNAFFTQVMAVSDKPLPGPPVTVYVNGEAVTLLTGEADGSYGTPVSEYRKDGKDHLWIKFYEGTQTTVDPFLSNYVANAERPWGPDRIGAGVAYVICTALVNDELFSSFPQFRFALPGISLYDPSRDDTVGGSGSHRWSDPSTWGGDGDNLPAVQLYNVLRGINYGEAWLYGLQNLPAARLPNVSWINAIAACRDPITGESGVEPTYRAGHECRVSTQIFDTVEVLLTACQGRISEIGGFYKVHVGAPGAPVVTFTDDNIISTAEQTFTPFFGLAETITGISATYPEPAEGWATKDAPPLLRPDLDAQAGDRRLLADVKFDAVPYAAQVQRIMRAALQEAQRARRHTYTLPPEFWVLEPGDVVAWTSARNGYATKLFRVDGVIDLANLNVLVDLTEVDPTDYDWDHATDFTAVTRTPIIFQRPAPQAVKDWFAEGDIVYDESGFARRPAIRLEWDGTVTADIAAIQFEARNNFGDNVVVHRGLSQNVAAGAILISQNLLPNTAYAVRGRYVPAGMRETLWSDWLAVTTPNVLIGERDIVQSLLYQMTELQDEIDRRMTLVENGMQIAANSSARGIRDNTRLRGQTVKMVDRVELKVDDSAAAIEEVRELTVSNEGAIASLTTSVTAQIAATNANVTTAAEAIAALDFSFSSYQVTVSAQLGALNSSVTSNSTAIAGIGAQQTILLDVNGYVSGTKQINGGPGSSSFTVLADFFRIAKPGSAGGAAVPAFDLGSVNGTVKLALRGDMLIDGTIIARHIAAGSITADKIQAGSIGTNQLAVGGVDINNLIAGAATKVTSYDGGTVALTSAGTTFDLVSSGALNFPVACNVVFQASMIGNGGSPTSPIPGVTFPSEAQSITFGVYVDDALVPGSERTFTYLNTLSGGYVFPMPGYFDMVIIGETVVTAGVHTVKIKARYARYPQGSTDPSSPVTVSSTKMIVTQNRR